MKQTTITEIGNRKITKITEIRDTISISELTQNEIQDEIDMQELIDFVEEIYGEE